MLRNLADLRGRQGRRDDMRELAVRARAIDEKTRRPGHPAFGRDLLLFAELALDDGRPDEAQQLAARRAPSSRRLMASTIRSSSMVDLMQAKIARRRHDLAGRAAAWSRRRSPPHRKQHRSAPSFGSILT
jgi:hypothetical protein